MKSNITTIGGGTGTFNVLSGLGKNRKLNLAAIVTVADSGGSTGELRDEFGILPPGDVRRAIVALAEDTEVVRRLFEYRFKEGRRIAGHTIGNLLLTALTDIMGDFERGIPACAGCHGPSGAGVPNQYPRLSGQYAEYTELQLKNFRSEERSNDSEKIMRTIADKLSDKQIKALADYIAGLR